MPSQLLRTVNGTGNYNWKRAVLSWPEEGQRIHGVAYIPAYPAGRTTDSGCSADRTKTQVYHL
jgi:hypothetical protein